MIRRISLFKTEIPLAKNYLLSYGKVSSFQTIFAKINTDKKETWGEFTYLPGYFKGLNFKEMWEKLVGFSKKMVGKDENYILSKLDKAKDFLILSPIRIAIERLSFLEELKESVPLTKTIFEEDFFKKLLPCEIKHYKAFKIKVGTSGSVLDDIEFVEKVSEKIPPDSELRIDANQGYSSLEEAIELTRRVKQKIIYLEQPFPVEKWDWNNKLMKKTGISVMLDESIQNKEDILKAVRIGVPYIKLKLAKIGSIYKTIDYMQFAEKNGLKVIIGNGVATDISCYLEALIWQKGKTKKAGEMNGFLKPELYSNKLQEKEGKIVFNNKEKFMCEVLPKSFIKDFVEYK